ncbi:caspase family protein [Pseudoduganella sp. LjRoot289]|uniref:caspase family protein n=1 Tax=Pseudoduganella sp. LjRoot289 TaxID=3342314 RepID=UPI003ECFBF2C
MAACTIQAKRAAHALASAAHAPLAGLTARSQPAALTWWTDLEGAAASPWPPAEPVALAIVLALAMLAGLATAPPPALAAAPTAAVPVASSAPSQPRAGRHALIIAIGDYISPAVPPLLGTDYDVDSASQMASAMQVPAQNIRVLRNRDATAARIEQEIAELNKRTQPGDRVFFYFSGHGSRYFNTAASEQGCVEALLPADSVPLTNGRIASLLKPISDKADKMFVFYDACHSGGILGKPLAVTRSLAGRRKLTPKFSPAGVADVCTKPANIKTRSLSSEAASAGALPQNIVMVSSSRPDEVSFDDEQGGGVATQAWRDCMLHDVKDLDQSGAISVNEIADCAQKQMEARFEGDKQFGVQHMILGGNAGFVPGWMAAGNTPQSKPGATLAGAAPPAPAAAASAAGAAAPAGAGTGAAAAGAAVVAASSSGGSPAVPAASGAALADILAQSDPRRKVTIGAASKVLRIGKDALDLSVTSSHDGHVYIVLLGSDNHSYYMLFPNDRDRNNAILAGQTLKLPRPQWRITAQGPMGTDRMLVVVSATPRDLGVLGNNKSGPFTYSLTDGAGRARLQWLLSTSAAVTQTECQPGAPARDAVRCSDAYGAALAEFTELP